MEIRSLGAFCSLYYNPACPLIAISRLLSLLSPHTEITTNCFSCLIKKEKKNYKSAAIAFIVKGPPIWHSVV